MKYCVYWEKRADEDLEELPDNIAAAIVKKVESYLVQNPRNLGQALTGQFAGLYRYRIGDYRIIYDIVEKEVRIYVIRVGHRKDIYD